MRVAIAGSHSIGRGQAPRLVVRLLASLPDRSTVLLRHPLDGPPGVFEQDTATVAKILGLGIEWFRPSPGATKPGRASVFHRDMQMIERSDVVFLFFHRRDVPAGDRYGGTVHLLDKALDANRPVYAYAISEEGLIERVGEYDPDDQYAYLLWR